MTRYKETQLRKWWKEESGLALSELLAAGLIEVGYDEQNKTFILGVNGPNYLDTLYAQLTNEN
jgi:hypothetical protein